MKVLLDTCVVSELQNPSGDPRVKDTVRRHARDDVFLSVITWGELQSGISLLPQGRKRAALEDWLSTLQDEYRDRILSIDMDIARFWGELTARVRTGGNMVAPADGLIAATALRHGMTIITRNTRHFASSGVPLIDPWADGGSAG